MPANEYLGAAGLDEVLILLRELRSELDASRHEVRSLSRRIELLLPAEVLIDAAKDFALHSTDADGILMGMGLRALAKHYNPVNLASVRRAMCALLRKGKAHA